jgi:hypothetical protein
MVRGDQWQAPRPPWEVLGVGFGASRTEVKKAFQSIAKVSHPDALHARLQSTAAHSHQRVVEEASERFRLAVRAYEMYDMKTGRWQPGLTSMINSHAARNMRQRMYEEPPFDLRRFSAPRLHPKTRAAVMGLYLSVTLGLAIESYMRTAPDRTASRAPPSNP